MLVFISYRRDDAPDAAGRVADWLRYRHGVDSVFFDVSNIPFGAKFEDVLGDQLRNATAMIVVIGPSWLNNRSWTEDDFVFREIKTGLDRGLPIVPILVNNATMPRKGDLPLAIAALAERHACEAPAAAFAHAMSDIENRIGFSMPKFRRGLLEILQRAQVSGLYLAPETAGRWLDDAKIAARVPDEESVLALILLERGVFKWSGVRTAALFAERGMYFCGRSPEETKEHGFVSYSDFPATEFGSTSRYVRLSAPVRGQTALFVMCFKIGYTELKIDIAAQDSDRSAIPLVRIWQDSTRGFPISIFGRLVNEMRAFIRDFFRDNGVPPDLAKNA